MLDTGLWGRRQRVVLDIEQLVSLESASWLQKEGWRT